MSTVAELVGKKRSHMNRPTTISSAMTRVKLFDLGAAALEDGVVSELLTLIVMGRPHVGQPGAASLTSLPQSVHLISATMFSLWLTGRPGQRMRKSRLRAL